MASEIIIPKLGLTMEEANLAKWSFETGQTVEQGQVIALIETDKVSFEIEAPAAGILYAIVPADSTVKVAHVIGYVAEDEAELAALQKEAPAGSDIPSDLPEDSEPVKQARQAEAETAQTGAGTRIFASPLAKRMAKEHNLDLSQITGTGPSGRIVEKDILKAMAEPAPSRPAVQAGSDLILTPAEEIPIKGIRKVISQNMHMSLSSQAQITLHTEASALGMQDIRSSFNKVLDPDESKVSYNAIIVKAAAFALRQHPHVNASVDGEFIKVWKQIHIGVAMDLGKGLIVPKVRNADTKSVKAISEELDRLVDQARQNTLSPDDLAGGTFTITNLGAWGIDDFTPIVNAPESAILGVGRIIEKPWVENGQVIARPGLALSLTFDHRIIDGTPGAKFLKTLARMIEEPHLMI